MCLAIPGKVIAMVDDSTELATVDVGGVRRNINVGLLPEGEVQPGDWVLVHVGFALSKVDEAEAQASLEFLEKMGEAYREELAALEESRI